MKFLARSLLRASVFFLVAILCGKTLFALDDVVRAKRKVEPFPMERVRLLPSPFKRAQEKNSEYLLSVEPDRLLANLRKNSGLEPRAQQYRGWESQSITGHSLGHYLSAVSKTYASTGDERFKERALYVVAELNECQSALGTGMLACDSKYVKTFDEVARGDIRSQGFDLNGLWVPWYATHKIFAGLLDAHRYCDSEQALEVAKKLGDWGAEVIKNLSFEQMQKMLACEYGGTNDAYYNLYAATGDEKYLKVGDRFYDLAIMKALSEGRDELQGRHGNTQIPKMVGLARRYELAGNGDLNAFATADFFWKRVTERHSYAIGGNTSGEHFGAPDIIGARLSTSTCETCNTYNMLKLTKELYEQSGDIEYVNYAERALYNHILASINKNDDKNSLYTYYVPLLQGGFRTYTDRENQWTCCHGTGMENHSQYNGQIYFYETLDGKDALYVNLLIPSTLNWSEKGLAFTLDSNGNVTVKTEKELDLIIKIRVPNNCRAKDDANVQNGYYLLGEKWDKGETTKKLDIIADWVVEPTPDIKNLVAFFRGPILYSGNVGPVQAKLATQREVETNVAPKDAVVVPVVVDDNPSVENLVDDAKNSERSFFVTPESARLTNAVPRDVTLEPFYNAKERYCVYFDVFDAKSWAQRKEEYAKERERAEKLSQATLAFFQPGEMQTERDVDFQSESSAFGEFNGRKWRDARNGGFFEFSMKVDPNAECALVITYWGGETGNRSFDVLIDGVVVAERRLSQDKPGRFFEEAYLIPNPEKKDVVRVRFQGKENAMAGGIFGARTMREEARKDIFGAEAPLYK